MYNPMPLQIKSFKCYPPLPFGNVWIAESLIKINLRKDGPSAVNPF